MQQETRATFYLTAMCAAPHVPGKDPQRLSQCFLQRGISGLCKRTPVCKLHRLSWRIDRSETILSHWALGGLGRCPGISEPQFPHLHSLLSTQAQGPAPPDLPDSLPAALTLKLNSELDSCQHLHLGLSALLPDFASS